MGLLTPGRRVYMLLTLLLVLGYLFAGFYPFQLKNPASGQRHNGATVEPGQGLHFRSPGIAYTEGKPRWLPQARATSRFALSLEVRTSRQRQYGPARIFTVSLNNVRRNLSVGQWGSDLNVNLRTPSTDVNGLPPYGIKNVFADRDWHRIDIHITPDKLDIDVDGDPVVDTPLPDQPLQAWDTRYRVALGNELTGDEPWLGDIRKAIVRVGDTSFDYLAPDVLQCPKTFTVHSKQSGQLIPFIHDDYDKRHARDWAINLFGFWPFGCWVVMLRRPRPGVLLATVLAAALSLTIETGQLLLFSGRVPSTEDFILNSVGGALGAWLTTKFAFSSRWRWLADAPED